MFVLIELFFIILLILFVVWQILLPLLQGRPVFPILYKNPKIIKEKKKIKKEINEIVEQTELMNQEEILRKYKKHLKR